jgi:hypothetical protein
MTALTKTVSRVSGAHRHEKSKTRALVLTLEPPAKVGVRLQGTCQTYRLDAEAIYELAVRAHEATIERLAQKIVKRDKMRVGSARALARKECRALLAPPAPAKKGGNQ